MTDKDLMEKLHQTLAENLLAKVQDPDAKASDLNVARQFLKDSHIECLAVEGSPFGDLVSTLPSFNDDDDTDITEMLRH